MAFWEAVVLPCLDALPHPWPASRACSGHFAAVGISHGALAIGHGQEPPLQRLRVPPSSYAFVYSQGDPH